MYARTALSRRSLRDRLAFALAFACAFCVAEALAQSGPPPYNVPIGSCESIRDAGYVEASCVCVNPVAFTHGRSKAYALVANPPTSSIGTPLQKGQCLAIHTFSSLKDVDCKATCAAMPVTPKLVAAPDKCWEIVSDQPAKQVPSNAAFAQVVGMQLTPTDPKKCPAKPSSPEAPADVRIGAKQERVAHER